MTASITVFLVMLSALSIAFNVAVLAYVAQNEPLKTELARGRAFTRQATRSHIRMVWVSTVLAIIYSVLFITRSAVALPLLAETGQEAIAWTGVVQHIVIHTSFVIAAFFLMRATWTMKRADEISEIQLKARREIATRRP